MNVPAEIVSDISSSTAAVFSGSLPLILILFGIGIGMFVIRSLISLLPK